MKTRDACPVRRVAAIDRVGPGRTIVLLDGCGHELVVNPTLVRDEMKCRQCLEAERAVGYEERKRQVREAGIRQRVPFHCGEEEDARQEPAPECARRRIVEVPEPEDDDDRCVDDILGGFFRLDDEDSVRMKKEELNALGRPLYVCRDCGMPKCKRRNTARCLDCDRAHRCQFGMPWLRRDA